MRAALTVERLKEVLHYAPSTGVFAWLQQTSSRALVDTVAGTTTSYGYRAIKIDGRVYKAHRLAYLYMTGAWPLHQVDHRDGSRSNNAWTNLRPATNTENLQNRRKARRTSKSGLLGVTQTGAKWQARIRVGGKQLNLGTRDTPEAAGALYLEAKERLHPFSTL